MPNQHSAPDLDARYLRLLSHSKYLYGRARAGLSSASPIVAAEALLRLHDSLEIFQIAVLGKLGVSCDVSFMEFWEKVKNKTADHYEPPFKAPFGSLNSMRNDFKHHAWQRRFNPPPLVPVKMPPSAG